MYSHRHFPNQKPNEHILMFLRRHWLEVLKIALTNICLAAIPIIFFVIIYNYTNYFESDIIAALIVLLGSAFYLFVILYAFTNFVDYYLDVWIVTNQRIINILSHIHQFDFLMIILKCFVEFISIFKIIFN